ncbi:MAG: ATP-dependent DNA helicase [Pseudomonadales bacterium]
MTSEISASSDIRILLGMDGEFPRLVPGYVERNAQLAMAEDVLGAINSQSHLMVEAGTGTGKTFAYLVAIMVSGSRAIISTGTKTLQDQLYNKDLPIVNALAGRRIKSALLKGRANYLCPERLERNLKVMATDTRPETVSRLLEIRSWYSRTRTGDLTEWLDLEGESDLIPLVTSTVDNCLASECPKYHECPLYAARTRASEADLVVVNHHLLFADFALQDDNISSLLPEVDVIVIDEAHQIGDIARHFFGTRLSSGQLMELSRDIVSEIFLLGGDDASLTQKAQLLELKTRELGDAFRVDTTNDIAAMLSARPARQLINDIDWVLGNLAAALEACGGRSKLLASCATRALRLADRFALLTEPAQVPDHAQWIDQRNRGFTIHLTPVSIAAPFSARLYGSSSTWILTSATLTVAERFDYIKATLGLNDFDAKRYESPFDYQRQARAWIPPIVERPGTDEHTHALMEALKPVLASVRGRTFLLFTSYRALHLAANILTQQGGVRFLVQGQSPKMQLLDRFREIENCVLLATHSFWEGVDVRGAGLRCLIIDKLPFASPDDPVTKTQVKVIGEAGGNGFTDYMIPQAAITLRQGFGRLIRENQDSGLFILGDNRVRTQAYGKLFVKSLPEMTWLDSAEEALAFLGSMEAAADTTR